MTSFPRRYRGITESHQMIDRKNPRSLWTAGIFTFSLESIHAHVGGGGGSGRGRLGLGGACCVCVAYPEGQ